MTAEETTELLLQIRHSQGTIEARVEQVHGHTESLKSDMKEVVRSIAVVEAKQEEHDRARGDQTARIDKIDTRLTALELAGAQQAGAVKGAAGVAKVGWAGVAAIGGILAFLVGVAIALFKR